MEEKYFFGYNFSIGKAECKTVLLIDPERYQEPLGTFIRYSSSTNSIKVGTCYPGVGWTQDITDIENYNILIQKIRREEGFDGCIEEIVNSAIFDVLQTILSIGNREHAIQDWKNEFIEAVKAGEIPDFKLPA